MTGRPARLGALAAGALASIAALTGCEHRAGDALLPTAAPSRAGVEVAAVHGLGPILTDSSGHSLYLFAPDLSSRVTCTGPCAGTWPPLTIAAGRRPDAGPGVLAEQLATLPDPNTGARIVTYAGHPLYRYAGDTTAGTANGQALFLNGGPWYVLQPTGQPVTDTAATPAGR